MIRDNKMESFFTGYLYPVIVAALVLVGNLFAIEVYLNTLNVILVCIGLLSCKTIRPLLPFLLTFIYQISIENTPSNPSASDFYFTGWRVPLHITLIVLLTLSILISLWRCGFFRLRNPFSLPLLAPTLLFSLSMLFNGYGHPEYYKMNFIWGAGVAVSIGILFYVFYLGLKEEDPEELVNYFTFLTLLISWILLLEMAHGLLAFDWIKNGRLIRHKIMLGYGVNNLVAYNISMLVPINFYGFMKSKHPMPYFITAVLLDLMTVITMSRNSILVGTVFFIICAVTCMCADEHKKLARVCFAFFAIAVTAFFFLKKDAIVTLLQDMIHKGTSDSGRFSIWRKSYDLFLQYPIFGAGFFGLNYTSGPFLPKTIVPDFSHNTIFQLLGTTGLFGFISYALYRLATLRRILSHINIEKWMFGLAYMVLAAQSLLDNYVFNFYTAFYPIAALAILILLDDQQRGDRRSDAYFLKHWRS